MYPRRKRIRRGSSGPDGSLGEPVAHDWTHLLLNLHIYLHLPSTLGLIVVGALGAMLFGLIVSGFLAHPRIVKDAFRLRLGGSVISSRPICTTG